MLPFFKYCFRCLPAMLLPAFLFAQDQVDVTVSEIGETKSTHSVRNILISGNKKTKAVVIRRELQFSEGIPYNSKDLEDKIRSSREWLMNTALFHEVLLTKLPVSEKELDVLVTVKERWYVFPFPHFRPVDRNLNQWLVEKNASLSRVNYGVKLTINNISGYNDKFRLSLINGYTRQLSIGYDRPYIDKQMKWGLSTSFGMGKNREVNYKTEENKQVFFKDNHYIRSFTAAAATLTYRPAIKTRHLFGIGFTHEVIEDTVAMLNPEYFADGRKTIQFPELFYTFRYFDLDYIPYPTRGYAAEITVGKKGFNRLLNLWYLTTKAQANWRTGKKTFLNMTGYGNIRLPFRQPFVMQRLLGYNDAFIQGYEYYVIDGVAGGYLRTTFTRELFSTSIRKPVGKRVAGERLPFRFFGKIYGNAGYVYNPQPGENPLANRMLFAGGAGLDILTAYDFTIKLEWTFNQLGQNGLFLHRKSTF